MTPDSRNYSRDLILSEFERHVVPIFQDKFFRVAVVGGDSKEPELVRLIAGKLNFEVSFFGIEANDNDFIFLDLNAANVPNEVLKESRFDLVLCSQVLEHIWALDNAFQNLTSLINPGGVLWISCPASNFAHGSPDYFSSGYTPALLENFCKRNNLVTLSTGIIGSKRLYLSRHSLFSWLDERNYNWPLFAYYAIPGSYLKKFVYQFSSSPIRIALTLASKKLSSDPKYAVETWGIFQKPIK